HAGIEQLARRGERDRAHAPLEQFDAEQRLEPTDLVADGARADVELVGRLGQAQVPRGRLEGPQGVERRHRMHEESSTNVRELIHCYSGKSSPLCQATSENPSKIG